MFCLIVLILERVNKFNDYVTKIIKKSLCQNKMNPFPLKISKYMFIFPVSYSLLRKNSLIFLTALCKLLNFPLVVDVGKSHCPL